MRWGVAQLAVHSVVTRTVGGSNPPAPVFIVDRRRDREAEGARLLIECGVKSSTEGSNPSVSGPAFMEYKVSDIVLVESIAGPAVHVKLTKRIEKWQRWDAVLIDEKDIEALRKAGVPYPKKGEREVWVFDEDIIKKKNKKRKV